MTIRTVVERTEPRFTWLDVVDPTREELSELVAERTGSTHLAVKDCLDPEHLPKFEAFDNYIFVILRAWMPSAPSDGGHRAGADPEARDLRGGRSSDHHPPDGPALAHGADGARTGERTTQARPRRARGSRSIS